MAIATLEEWKIYPFTLNGFSFESRVKIGSDMWHKIITIPVSVFTDLNRECLTDLIKGEWNRESIIAQLQIINEGGSEAFIDLV